MNKDQFNSAIGTCGLLPQALLEHVLEVSQQMDDKGRELLWKAVQQEYSQYIPLVQRKLERIEHAISQVESDLQPKTIRRPAKPYQPAVSERAHKQL